MNSVFVLKNQFRKFIKGLVVVSVLFILNPQLMNAQVTVSGGTGASAGSPYATLTAAIGAINAGGALTAPVIVNVPAGYTENLTGRITLTMTGTLANPITIQKNGAGANPILTSFTGTVATPSNAADGMFVLAGCDYVTIDGIDLQEKSTNTTTTSVMEFGYGLFKLSATDGCQNNTIKNCTITLKRLQNTAWTAPGHNGSVGIAVHNGLHNASGVLTVTAPSGSNSFNKIYSNTIQNCNAGIVFIGFGASSPFTLGDTNNDIGGIAGSTGNTILNYGGGAATNPATGIFANQQWGLNCSFNNINSNDGAGVNHTTTLRGIFLNSSSTSASANCNNNTVTVKSSGTISQMTGIDVQFGSTAAGNTINVNNNTVQNCVYTSATTGTFQGILTSNTAANVNVSGNTVTNNTLSGTGQMDGIVIQSTPTTVVANNNIVSNNLKTATGTMNGMYTSGAAGNVTMNNNTVTGNTINGGAATSTLHGIRNSFSTITISGNTITNNRILSMSGASVGEVNGYSNVQFPVNETITNNIISGLSVGGSSTAVTHLVRGISVSSATSAVANWSGNTIFNLTYNGTAGAATVSGIQSTAGGNMTITKNKIYNDTASGTGSAVNGINLPAGTTYNISNNLIGHLYTPDATGMNSINGINAPGVSTLNLYYNTIFLNAVSNSLTTFGSSCVLFGSASTVLNLRNNILVNNSVPAQESLNNNANGVSACLRRNGGTSGTVPANYSTASNNNAYWCNPVAGTDCHATYVEGTGSITNLENGLADMKVFMINRDQASMEENPNFASLVGANSQYLHINASIPTQLESSAANIATFTTDYDGHIRFGNAGYPGGSAGFPTGGTAPDIGADEFAGTFLDLADPSIGYTLLTNTCLFGDRTLTANISDVSGVPTAGLLMPRIYYRKNAGAWFSQPGTLISGNGFNGSWSFNIQATAMGGLTTGDIVQYYIIAQDNASPTPNIGSNPASGLIATDVNNVTGAPVAPNSFSVTPLPVISSATVTPLSCNGYGNGQIVVTSTAASPVFSALPNSSQFPEGTFTGLLAGNYTIVVTDASACSGSSVVTVTEPAVLLANISAPPILCNGGTTTLTAGQTGGNTGFTYQWIDGYVAAASLVVNPDKDNTLYQTNSGNSNALGTQILSGNSHVNNARRALLHFDLSPIPVTAIINSANLMLTCSGGSTTAGPQNMSLYRMLESWGEGTSVATSQLGLGVPATTGDATWLKRFFPATNWLTNGGSFVPAASATTSVNAPGAYTWSGTSLTADVQTWVSNTSSNHGWVLRGVETSLHQAKKFFSRQFATVASRPTLTVNYSLPNVIATGAVLSNVTPGTYTVIVTDANNCTSSTSITITQPPALNVSASSTPIACNGGTTDLNSVVSGGSGSYSYQWISGQSTNTISLGADKDNTIYEQNPANSNGIGTQFLCGNNGSNFKNRALLHFNIAGNIPSGSLIDDVTLTLNCTGSSGASGTQLHSLYPLLENWGEGTSDASGAPGTGAPATTGDATWLKAFFPSTNWTTVGGTFNPTPSAGVFVNLAGFYNWNDIPMRADVQGWLDNPASNYGWMLKGVESAAFQAKRYSSREDFTPANRPVLTVVYTANTVVGTTSSVNGLPAGTYTLVVTDANNCTASTIITVTEPSPVPVTASASPSGSICTGSAVTLNGGGALTYTWTDGVNAYTDGLAFTPSATATYTVTGTDGNGCTATSTIEVMVAPCNASLDLKFYIQGFYDVAVGSMRTVLFNQGEEAIQTANCDSVKIELHHASSPYALFEDYVGIVDTAGHILCNFSPAVLGNSYYIVVRHRNAVETWSAAPVTMTSLTTYNFSTGNAQSFGPNQFEVLPNIWALFSGDIDQSGGIDGDDFNLLDPDIQSGNGGYLSTDLDGSGGIDGDDFNIFDPNAQIGVGAFMP
ncbi:MAG: right-handed parallel beta-helix repeat-containing protein [Chitinophagaceae bacterium]|nr:right-handed parallel beta-helix repeat-containing protein [Chitinophagaceae bacterium]